MNAQQVWQAQSIEAPRMSLAYVRHVASDFERRRWLRAAFGSVMLLGVCGLYTVQAWLMFSTKPLLAAGSVCIVLGMLYVLYRLYRHLTTEPNPGDVGVLDTLRFQRRQLERQRNWRRNGWRWVIAALLPGWVLLVASLYVEHDPVPWRTIGATILMFIAAMVLSILHGEWKARRSQREIDALDSLAGDL
jgi:hypothetical protein